MDIKDFDIFGEDSENPYKSSVLPPEIVVKEQFRTMTVLEVESTIDKIKRLSNRAVSCLITGKNLEKNNVEQFSWALYLLEQALHHTRELANELENGDYLEQIPVDFPVESSKTTVEKDRISIDLPLLVPKRKPNQHTTYYSDKLEKMLKKVDIPHRLQTEKVAITLLHCYKNDHAKWAKRDHDNLDVKWLVDALNNYFFVDDGPFRTSLYHHTVADSRDHTVVYLVPILDFPAFISEKIPEWENGEVR